MKTVLVETKLYDINDLSLEVNKHLKTKVLERYWDWNVEGEYWNDWIIENCEAELEQLGFDNIIVQYSDFSSQGYGARILCEIALLDAMKLLEINTTDSVQQLINSNMLEFDDLKITAIDHRYFHDNTLTINTPEYYDDQIRCEDELRDLTSYVASRTLDYIKAKSKDVYRKLQNTYFDLTSEEIVLESLQDELFTQDGKIFDTWHHNIIAAA
ncbi:MAG: hypothetical protein HQK65_02250 [Desulfamplus sp.]|nr:hypothetical protein [Desulfamplus sp.]